MASASRLTESVQYLDELIYLISSCRNTSQYVSIDDVVDSDHCLCLLNALPDGWGLVGSNLVCKYRVPSDWIAKRLELSVEFLNKSVGKGSLEVVKVDPSTIELTIMNGSSLLIRHFVCAYKISRVYEAVLKRG